MKRSPRVLLLVAIVLAVTTGVARAGVPVFFFGADIVRLTTRIDDQTGGATSFSGTANAVTLRLKGGAHFLPFLDAERHLVTAEARLLEGGKQLGVFKDYDSSN